MFSVGKLNWTTMRRTLLVSVLLMTAAIGVISPVSAQTSGTKTSTPAAPAATATPTVDLLQSLLQAAQTTEEAGSEDAFSFAALLPGLHVERGADGAFIIGDPEAPITIVEFSDWACPHCQEYRGVIEQIITDYVISGKARFEFRMFPTAGGQQSAAFGVIAECADGMITDEDGVGYGFWLSIDVLYAMAEGGTYFTQEALQTYADALGLDPDELLTCGRAAETPQVVTDIDFGNEAGVSGTPAVMVRHPSEEGLSAPEFIELNGRQYAGGGVPYDVLAEVIEAANG